MAVLSGGAVIIPTSQMKTLRFRESEELPNFLQSSESQEPNPDASNVVQPLSESLLPPWKKQSLWIQRTKAPLLSSSTVTLL